MNIAIEIHLDALQDGFDRPEADLTTASSKLLADLIELAAERNAAPLEPGDLTPEERGNLTDLKVKGFVDSYEDEGVVWVTILNQEGA